MQSLTFITSNPNKAQILRDYLGVAVAHQALDISEIQSLDVTEVATAKAKAAYAVLGTLVLVEDVSLSIEARNGLPGPFVKWFLDTIGTDGITDLVPLAADRTTVATTCYALCDEQGVRCFVGEQRGRIAAAPRGDNGFGFDSIFIPEGYELTWAEMDATEQRSISMRRLALEQIARYLQMPTE